MNIVMCKAKTYEITMSSSVISDFRRRVNGILTLLGCYAALIGSYRRFGTTSRSHLQGSSSPKRMPGTFGSYIRNGVGVDWLLENVMLANRVSGG